MQDRLIFLWFCFVFGTVLLGAGEGVMSLQPSALAGVLYERTGMVGCGLHSRGVCVTSSAHFVINVPSLCHFLMSANADKQQKQEASHELFKWDRTIEEERGRKIREKNIHWFEMILK